jgi:anhydro-N-acetylmuramic acid kinase
MYGDYLLFQSQNESRVMLNLGGIANLSFLPKNGSLNDIFSSDVGPGNTIMDAYCQKHFSQLFDKDAAIARAGTVSLELLDTLLSDWLTDFFEQPFPKTTGPEVFNLEYLDTAIEMSESQQLSHYDIVATLCEFSAVCIVKSLLTTAKNESDLHVYVSGGGIHNPLLLERITLLLKDKLPGAEVHSTDSLSINPDAKEAVLFALLANETLCSDGNTFAGTEKNMPNITMGKISFAD